MKKIIKHQVRGQEYYSLDLYDEMGRLVSSMEPVNKDGSYEDDSTQITFWQYKYTETATYSRHCGNGEGCFWTEWELVDGYEPDDEDDSDEEEKNYSKVICRRKKGSLTSTTGRR